MTRNRASARAAGTAFETKIARYLSAILGDDRIERRVKFGRNDRGDIAGVRVHGQRVVVECKDHGGSVEVGAWLREADVERGNDDALIGAVVAKRRGTADPAEQLVMMTVADLVALIIGYRPPDVLPSSPSPLVVSGDRPTPPPQDAA